MPCIYKKCFRGRRTRQCSRIWCNVTILNWSTFWNLDGLNEFEHIKVYIRLCRTSIELLPSWGSVLHTVSNCRLRSYRVGKSYIFWVDVCSYSHFMWFNRRLGSHVLRPSSHITSQLPKISVVAMSIPVRKSPLCLIIDSSHGSEGRELLKSRVSAHEKGYTRLSLLNIGMRATKWQRDETSPDKTACQMAHVLFSI